MELKSFVPFSGSSEQQKQVDFHLNRTRLWLFFRFDLGFAQRELETAARAVALEADDVLGGH